MRQNVLSKASKEGKYKFIFLKIDCQLFKLLITLILIGVEAIDDAMMIYISVTRVKELIDEVLKPVIKEAKKESEYTRVVK